MDCEIRKKQQCGIKVAPGQMALLPDEVGYDVCMLADPRHEIFCREVAIRNNSTQAYLVAYPHCKVTTAGVNGCKLLKKAKVQNRVAEIAANRLKKLEVTHEKVLMELAKMAFVNPQDFYQQDGSLKPIVDLDPDVAASLESVKVRTTMEKDGDEINRVEVAEIKHTSKKAALETLAKMQGYFAPDKSEISGPNGGAISVVNNMSDDELDAEIARLMAVNAGVAGAGDGGNDGAG